MGRNGSGSFQGQLLPQKFFRKGTFTAGGFFALESMRPDAAREPAPLAPSGLIRNGSGLAPHPRLSGLTEPSLSWAGEARLEAGWQSSNTRLAVPRWQSDPQPQIRTKGNWSPSGPPISSLPGIYQVWGGRESEKSEFGRKLWGGQGRNLLSGQ